MATRKKTPKPRKKRAKVKKAGSSSRVGKALDACDFDLKQAEATPDENLPAAEGGVA